MSAFCADVLTPGRIGSVPYLNARPLIRGIEDRVVLDVPSVLASRFADGEFDAALLPVFEALTGERATLVDDVAIACRGEVFSVFVAHREPLAEVNSIALDPSSRTSVNLLRCLLAEFHGLKPTCTSGIGGAEQARLIIGDPAIAFRREHADGGWQFLDLGAEWQRCTGLPFVFACWVLRDGAEALHELAEALRAVKTRGLAYRGAIAAETDDAAFADRYLKEFIKFDLGEQEKTAIQLFGRLVHKHGLAAGKFETDLTYV